MTLLRRGLMGLGGLLLLLAVFTAGAYVDQTFPEYVPLLQVGAPRGQADRATMDQALRVIEAHYYDPKVDSGKLSAGTVKGMVQSLGDSYSTYLSPDEYRLQQDQYAGRHPGMIGIYVNYQNGYPVVGGVLPNSPALRAGLQTDDVILSIGGLDTHNLTQERTSALIRGPAGTPVAMHVRRGASGPESDVTVTRENFQSPTVQSMRLEGDVLYMRIYQFGNSTQQEFDAQLQAGQPGARGVVLDLRDNGGGYVSAAAAVISRFIASGEAFEQRSRDGQVDTTNVEGSHPATQVPLVVLVNENSASASEIVAGSLQARGRARLVGAKTFGKGSVQIDYRLDNGGDLHLTVAHWYLPNKRTIDKQGLTPDAPVALADKQAMFDVVQFARGHASDTQLNRALELLAAP
ncbi:MAG TPA: S41 family peptidase [Candidatus Dormibacteraeota bacterium]